MARTTRVAFTSSMSGRSRSITAIASSTSAMVWSSVCVWQATVGKPVSVSAAHTCTQQLRPRRLGNGANGRPRRTALVVLLFCCCCCCCGRCGYSCGSGAATATTSTTITATSTSSSVNRSATRDRGSVSFSTEAGGAGASQRVQRVSNCTPASQRHESGRRAVVLWQWQHRCRHLRRHSCGCSCCLSSSDGCSCGAATAAAGRCCCWCFRFSHCDSWYDGIRDGHDVHSQLPAQDAHTDATQRHTTGQDHPLRLGP